MATRDYKRLDVVSFGRLLLETGDLDPIYIALNRTGWSLQKKARWLMVYCAYYHAGVACYIADTEDGELFWEWMMTAARNEDAEPTPFGARWPRGHERRHFRGQQAVKGVQDWQHRYPEHPELMFINLAQPNLRDVKKFESVRARALEHRSVGEWLSFKMVDLVDACMGVHVDQSNVMNFMYDTPRNSLLREWRERIGMGQSVRPRDETATIVAMNEWLLHEMRGLDCPHKPGRPVDNFCLETIWCKHQSHLNGHYPLLNDIEEIRAGLQPWLSCSPSAREFMECMPRGRLGG